MIEQSSCHCGECPFTARLIAPGRFVVALLFVITASAQSIPNTSPSTVAVEEAIVLTPFTVDTTRDRGYQAENTLSGSRLNSSLNDTPASVSVFTKEFLQDVGLTEL